MTQENALTMAIQAAGGCADTCTATVIHCLDMGGPHAESAHIKLMLDCAEVCRTSADLMLRDSQYSESMCELCADICDACAADCERFTDDPMMMACAQTCRQCAEACRGMVQQARAA